MKNIGRRLLSSICAFALSANCVVGVIAQDKKHIRQNDGRADNVLPGATLIESVTITAVDPAGSTSHAPEGANSSTVKRARIGGGSIFQFFSQEMSFDNNLVIGAPFSADISSEAIQTLADGTRIIQSFAGRIYRDSQGRTRHERAFRMGGTSESIQTITIYDPVGGARYILDPAAKIAYKTEVPVIHQMHPQHSSPSASASPSSSANAEARKKVNVSSEVTQGRAIKKAAPPYPQTAKAARVSGLSQVEVLISETGEVLNANAVSGHPLLRDAALEGARRWIFSPTTLSGRPVKIRGLLQFNFKLTNEEPAPAQAARSVAKYTLNTERLSNQIIEGIECEGARTVTTIPVGAIGNDRPIETVSETWYSPELRIMILSKRSDPRFGESTYRATNIDRTGPESALFQVLPDYTIKESEK
jgi:TonB family protein